MAVGDNIIFDPTRQELNVADLILAVSMVSIPHHRHHHHSIPDGDTVVDDDSGGGEHVKRDDLQGKKSNEIRIVAVRTIDSPARLTTPGQPSSSSLSLSSSSSASTLVAKQAGTVAPTMTMTTTTTTTTTTAADSKSTRPVHHHHHHHHQLHHGNVSESESSCSGGVWRPPRGGLRPRIFKEIIHRLTQNGGVAHDIFDGLDSFQV